MKRVKRFSRRYCTVCRCGCAFLIAIGTCAYFLNIDKFFDGRHLSPFRLFSRFQSAKHPGVKPHFFNTAGYGIQKNSAGNAGEDSRMRVAAHISRLGNITIDVAEIMDIDRKSWVIETMNEESLRNWANYDTLAKNVEKRKAQLKQELAMSAIAKKSAAILKAEWDAENRNKTNETLQFYIPSPLRNPTDDNDTTDYFTYYFLNETAHREILVELYAWVNPIPKKRKPILNPWWNMTRQYVWNIYSAFPVASHRGNQGPQLALIGPDPKIPFSHPSDARNVPYEAMMKSRYFVQFPSGDISEFKKYRRQHESGGDTMTWLADLPFVEEVAWIYPPEQIQEACLTFGILDGYKQLMQNFTACHNPSTFPPAGSQYNLTICYPIPPMHDSKKQEYSGYLGLPQNIMYHIRHGVDQLVVYLGVEHRKHAMALLRPFILRRKVTVIFLDATGSPHHALSNEYSKNDYRVYDLGGVSVLVENWLHNDCLTRFRGRTRLLVSMGVDEFLYVPAWRTSPGWAASSATVFDALLPLLTRGCSSDFNTLGSFTWNKPENPYDDMLLQSIEHYQNPRIGWTMKSLFNPDCVSVIWTHLPSDCFGRVCRRLRRPLLEFAHVRAVVGELPDLNRSSLPQDPLPENRTVVFDKLFVEEMRFLKPELCRWMKEAGFGCEPKHWLPPS